jgi:hypothetical protein
MFTANSRTRPRPTVGEKDKTKGKMTNMDQKYSLVNEIKPNR